MSVYTVVETPLASGDPRRLYTTDYPRGAQKVLVVSSSIRSIYCRGVVQPAHRLPSYFVLAFRLRKLGLGLMCEYLSK